LNLYKIWKETHGATIFGAIFISILYTTLVVHNVLNAQSNFGDFVEHANVAEKITNGGIIPPHFLYHMLLISIHKLFNLSFHFATYTITFICVFITYIIAYKIIENDLNVSNKYLLGFAVFFLLISHPIVLLFPFDQHLYFGYLASNVYHNPTIVLLKPIALVHFILLCKILNGDLVQWSLARKIIVMATLTALSIVAKPSYIISLLPAMGVLLTLRYFLLYPKDTTEFWVLVLGLLLPSFVILLSQYVYFYGSNSNNSIVIGLFSVFKINSQLWTLVPKLLASIAFPISLFFIMGKRLVRQLDFQLSSLMFLMALIYSYCLVDWVNGLPEGNFWWTAQITHFLLLFVCIRAYLDELYRHPTKYLRRDIYIPAYVGGLQLISGIIWFAANIEGSYL
jgi:hypothetical protein